MAKPLDALSLDVVSDGGNTNCFPYVFVPDPVQNSLACCLTEAPHRSGRDFLFQGFVESPGLALVGEGWNEDCIDEPRLDVHWDAWVFEEGG